MDIEVKNTKNTNIRNHGRAETFNGDSQTVLMWTERKGYIPLQVEGFSEWIKTQDVFGHNVYFCSTQ